MCSILQHVCLLRSLHEVVLTGDFRPADVAEAQALGRGRPRAASNPVRSADAACFRAPRARSGGLPRGSPHRRERLPFRAEYHRPPELHVGSTARLRSSSLFISHRDVRPGSPGPPSARLMFGGSNHLHRTESRECSSRLSVFKEDYSSLAARPSVMTRLACLVGRRP